jgi:hypothetical protein
MKEFIFDLLNPSETADFQLIRPVFPEKAAMGIFLRSGKLTS